MKMKSKNKKTVKSNRGRITMVDIEHTLLRGRSTAKCNRTMAKVKRKKQQQSRFSFPDRWQKDDTKGISFRMNWKWAKKKRKRRNKRNIEFGEMFGCPKRNGLSPFFHSSISWLTRDENRTRKSRFERRNRPNGDCTSSGDDEGRRAKTILTTKL